MAFERPGAKMGGGRLSSDSAMMEEKTAAGHKGRGAGENPPNRFDRLHLEPDLEFAQADPDDPDVPSPKTELYRDASRTAIAYNQSPDVGFEASVNPYRGCEHGCVYCYARPTHEYLGLSSGLDFETKIFVKEDAPHLLRSELMAESWKPQVIAVSGVTDAYQPVERRLGITRKCLEVLAEFRNPLVIITKSRLVTRDIDVLRELAKFHACAVMVSVTTLRPEVQRVMEPRASSPTARLEAIRELAAAGIPVGVMVAPVVPGLTDHEIPAILDAAAEAGARRAGYVMLRLPFAVKSLFESWLERHFPERKSKVLNRIRDMRGGNLNDPRFGSRMRGEGAFADETAALFRIARAKAGLDRKPPPLSTEHFRRPGWSQGTLFDALGLAGGPGTG